MEHYRSNWAVVLGLALGMATGLVQAQQQPVLSASISPAEPTLSASQPMVAAPEPLVTALRPLLSSSPNPLRIAPPTAGEHRVADRQFWILVASTAGSAVLDGETTIHGLQRGGLREMNPLLGSHPDRARFYVTVGAGDAALVYVAYRLKRGGHDKLWKMPVVGAGSVHLGGAINNLLRY